MGSLSNLKKLFFIRMGMNFDYAIYTASPSIASGVEEWYNLKYTATFQYPKETVRF